MAHTAQKTLITLDSRDNLFRGVTWTFVHPHEFVYRTRTWGSDVSTRYDCAASSQLGSRPQYKRGGRADEKSFGRLGGGCPSSHLGAGCAGAGADGDGGEEGASDSVLRCYERSHTAGHSRKRAPHTIARNVAGR